MPSLSVVIITLNEEKNLARCIDSVQEVADEIVIIDSFSTDRTEQIAREKGARFIQHAFEDYVQQHSFADGQATYDHILSLDADEALSSDLAQSIKVAKKYWKSDGYFMNRKTNYCGKWINHSGWYPDKKLRIYDRRKGKWVGQKLHERFTLVTGSTTSHLKGDILHYSYYSIEGHVLQANKFSTMAAAVLIESGTKIPKHYLVIKPLAKFIRNYILKLGFLDGIYGFIICRITATETFYKYVKAYQHIRSNRKK
ncbi:MAG: glycosyltransferase family 2 protein [Bacteroidetes bacterium]|nr:glycosyltransferase family 2 protein [Bacteroidota bacterium]